jgi:hypothetical protein
MFPVHAVPSIFASRQAGVRVEGSARLSVHGLAPTGARAR